MGWESLRRISDLIKSYEITNPLKLTNKRGTSKTFKSNKVDESRDCLNQIILLLSHNKTSVGQSVLFLISIVSCCYIDSSKRQAL